MTTAPNGAYDYCLREDKLPEEQLQGIDLSSLRLMVNCAEPVRASTFERFWQRFSPYGLRKSAQVAGYGLAEHTLCVTNGGSRTVARADHGTEGAAEKQRFVSCGRPEGDVDLRIVDPDSHRPLGDGEVGEIWVDSPSKAAGYWRMPEESRAHFQARIARDEERADLSAHRRSRLHRCRRTVRLRTPARHAHRQRSQPVSRRRRGRAGGRIPSAAGRPRRRLRREPTRSRHRRTGRAGGGRDRDGRSRGAAPRRPAELRRRRSIWWRACRAAPSSERLRARSRVSSCRQKWERWRRHPARGAARQWRRSCCRHRCDDRPPGRRRGRDRRSQRHARPARSRLDRAGQSEPAAGATARGGRAGDARAPGAGRRHVADPVSAVSATSRPRWPSFAPAQAGPRRSSTCSKGSRQGCRTRSASACGRMRRRSLPARAVPAARPASKSCSPAPPAFSAPSC